MGRGSSGGGGGGLGSSGGNSITPRSSRNLISERERNPESVDEVLSVLKDVNDQYGYTIYDANVVDIGNSTAIAYYELGADNIAVNQRYFDAAKMNSAYDNCVKSGFHPSRGNKTGTQAVVSHELGHALTDEAARKNGMDFDSMAQKIVVDAFGNKSRRSTGRIAEKISGYATKNNAECIAEAFCDVYCNGKKAAAESHSIVNRLNGYLARTPSRPSGYNIKK